MLKKQTVWLLTMLSLMIVLSVYYMTSPDNEDLAYIDSGQEVTEEATTTDDVSDDASEATENDDSTEVDNFSNLGGDELFTTIRMEIQDDRSEQKDRYEEVLASSNATTEEKNEAWDEIDKLDQLSTKESILEESIISSADYEDVLVRHDEDKVHVHVKVDELSGEEANNIMQMVKDEFGEIRVDVNYQPTES
ncbi:SpoIIIAH-like family protein [Oceanobacillus halotolerans]|uniref:SpoIIIAH-like family protein n=1 Tax=Oceanobacillus halotolerans TaxID=2663380 RepID=UPI0013DB2387|nr:SpoIIIAH-like family protein [Oceanobacillus halotolerans]